jgi:hypothetical protein
MKNKRFLLLSILLIAATAFGANAQSQDRDNPTPFASNTVKGNGIGKKVDYFYSFTAGPGEVVVTVDLKAKAGSTNADVEIFDADSKIFYVYPNATTTAEHAVKRFTLSSKQPLILRLSFDSSAGEYSIKLTGPVELPAPAVEPAASDPAVAATAEQPAMSSSESDAATGTTADTAKSSKGSKLNFGVNILQSVGNQFGLPTSGVLHFLMKDGTVQDIDLSKVKTASVTKQ